MKRNPETAYLVSNEEFDKQLDELGWSPGDVVTMAGMYVERGMYSMKKSIRDFFRELLELLFQAAALVIDTAPHILPRGAGDSRSASLRHIGMGRIPEHADAVVLPLHTDLSLATRFGLVQYHTCQDTGADAAKRHRGIAGTTRTSRWRRATVCTSYSSCIGIIGYFTIPTVAGWIIQAGGMGGYGRNVNQMAGRAGSMAGSVAGAAAGNAVGRVGKLLK